MRHLAITGLLLSIISCAGATDAVDRVVDLDEAADDEAPAAITLSEITVVSGEGLAVVAEPTSLCEGGCREDPDALETTRVSLADPYLEVRALAVETEDKRETFLAVRTDAGWTKIETPFLSAYSDDPGCPSIEREDGIAEVRVERGTLVIVTTADRGWTEDGEHYDSMAITAARTCPVSDEGSIECGTPEKIEVKITDGERTKDVFATKYWVNADGELEVAQPFDDAM